MRLWLCLAAAMLVAPASASERTEVGVVTNFGLAYLPLILMEHHGLWERHADARGLPLTVHYRRLGGGAAINEALLSDSVQVAVGGVTPMLTLWDRTRGNFGVRGLSAVNASPMYFLTNRTDVDDLTGFGPSDRIVTPSVRVSIQAIVLGMAVEQAFGEGQWGALDAIQTGMSHPDAYAALTTGAAQITGYLSSSPFQERALAQPGIRKLFSSFDVMGGPATFIVSWAKAGFVEDNPGLTAAFLDAKAEAMAMIERDPEAALDTYFAVTGDGTDRALIAAILDRGDFTFSRTPQETLKYADFMYRSGLIRQRPVSAGEFFFDLGLPGGS